MLCFFFGKVSVGESWVSFQPFLDNHSIPPSTPPELYHQPLFPLLPQVFVSPHELAPDALRTFPVVGEASACAGWGEGGATRSTLEHPTCSGSQVTVDA